MDNLSRQARPDPWPLQRKYSRDRQFLREMGIAEENALLETPSEARGFPSYEKLFARYASMVEDQSRMLEIQARLIRQRNRWYRRWRLTSGALLLIVVAHVVYFLLRVLFR